MQPPGWTDLPMLPRRIRSHPPTSRTLPRRAEAPAWRRTWAGPAPPTRAPSAPASGSPPPCAASGMIGHGHGVGAVWRLRGTRATAFSHRSMTTPRPLLLRGSVQELGDIELPVLPPSPALRFAAGR